MRLTLHPVAAGRDARASVQGDILIYDGETFDCSSVPEGGRGIPAGDHPFVGNIERVDGVIVAEIIWCFSGRAPELETMSVDISAGEIEPWPSS